MRCVSAKNLPSCVAYPSVTSVRSSLLADALSSPVFCATSVIDMRRASSPKASMTLRPLAKPLTKSAPFSSSYFNASRSRVVRYTNKSQITHSSGCCNGQSDLSIARKFVLIGSLYMDKTVESAAAAVASINDGATVMIGGFGGSGAPIELIHALIDRRPKNLTVVNNNAGNGRIGIAAMIDAGMVRKMICSFPRSSDPRAFTDRYLAGEIELELVPQGTLAERIRAG